MIFRFVEFFFISVFVVLGIPAIKKQINNLSDSGDFIGSIGL